MRQGPRGRDAVTGVGTDLLEIERLERALARRPRLAERLFSEGELAYARARRRPGRHLAARFAAKESVLKALGVTAGLPMREIEVVPGPPPTVRLFGAAASAAAGRQLHISLSHTDSHASAVAICE